MKLSNALVPLGSFALAILLSIVAGPAAARLTLRAADDATGEPPPCATWTLTKHRGTAKKWKLTVEELPSTLDAAEPVLCEESTLVNLTATVIWKNAAGVVQPPSVLPYRLLVGTKPKNFPAGNGQKWNVAPMSEQLNKFKDQVEDQWNDSVDAHDLLGNPVPGVPPAGSKLVSVSITGPQLLNFETVGWVFCKVSKKYGLFTPRPLHYDVDIDGTGGGVN
jgi:hypothetical protein